MPQFRSILMSFPNHRVLQLIALSLLGCLVFGNTLFNYFVWDDLPILLNNSAYQAIDLTRIFTTPANGLEYLPIRDITLAIDHAVWGGNPVGYHLTNLLLYVANVLTVYCLTLGAAKYITTTLTETTVESPELLAFWSAALFAVHPLHSEPVSFITGRNTLLSGLFTFLACRYYLDFLVAAAARRNVSYCASLLGYTLAILSKATSIFLPLFFLPCLLLGNRRPRTFLSVLPFFAVAGGAYYLFTTIARQVNIISRAADSGQMPGFSRVAVAVQIPFFYLAKLFLPLNLTPEYETHFATGMLSAPALAALLVLLLSGVAVVFYRRVAPWPFFAWCWFCTALVPVLHLIPTSTIVADRYALLPSYAFCLLAAYLLVAGRRVGKKLAPVLSCGIVVIWSVLAMQQNRVWNTDLSLWQHAVKTCPKSAKALSNLGMQYFTRGDYKDAFFYLERASAVSGSREPFYDYCQGCLAFDNGDYRRAIRFFELAVAKQEDLIEALYYIGAAYEKLNDKTNAASYYRKVISSVYPDFRFKQQATERLMLLSAPH